MVSDWGAIGELLNHGVAADRAAAGVLALDASVDMDMVGGVFADDLKDADREGPGAAQTTRRSGAAHPAREGAARAVRQARCSTTTPNAKRASCSRPSIARRRAPSRASRSCCSRTTASCCRCDPAKLRSVAVIGALATDGLSSLGSWRAQGKADEVVTILAGITAAAPKTLKVLYRAGRGSAHAPICRAFLPR